MRGLSEGRSCRAEGGWGVHTPVGLLNPAVLQCASLFSATTITPHSCPSSPGVGSIQSLKALQGSALLSPGPGWGLTDQERDTNLGPGCGEAGLFRRLRTQEPRLEWRQPPQASCPPASQGLATKPILGLKLSCPRGCRSRGRTRRVAEVSPHRLPNSTKKPRSARVRGPQCSQLWPA